MKPKLTPEQRVSEKIYAWLQLQHLRIYEDISGDASTLSQIKNQWVADELAKILNANTEERCEQHTTWQYRPDGTTECADCGYTPCPVHDNRRKYYLEELRPKCTCGGEE